MQRDFFPLLKFFITEALPLLLMGLALASGGSALELADIDSTRHRGKLLAASHRSHPCSPQLPKPCHANPIHFLDRVFPATVVPVWSTGKKNNSDLVIAYLLA